MGFGASFSYSFKRFSPLILEPNTSIRKESLSRVFKSDFLVFSTTTSILVFSHKHLSYPLLYLSYWDLYCERILGDQVFRSPKFSGLAGSRCFEF